MTDTQLLQECFNYLCPEFLALLSVKCPEFLHSTVSHLFFLSHFFGGGHEQPITKLCINIQDDSVACASLSKVMA
jgi:hypothetical protein